MDYQKRNWTNNQAPAINAFNLNYMDNGIFEAHQEIKDLENEIDKTKEDVNAELTELDFNLAGVESDLASAKRFLPSLIKNPQMYILNGCTESNDGNTSITEKCCGADLGKTIIKGAFKFKFSGTIDAENMYHPTNNPSGEKCSLIASLTKSGCQQSQHITKGAWRLGVTPLFASIEYFDPDITAEVPIILYRHYFANPLEVDEEYTYSFETIGNPGNNGSNCYMNFKFPAPDSEGKTTIMKFPPDNKVMLFSNWENYSGQYVITEHYYSTSGKCRPHFTKWKFEATDDIEDYISKGGENKTSPKTNYLRHDFSIYPDGFLSTAPTGQCYSLFSNEEYGATALG